MKIYRFNADTGAYLGEDFADEYPLERGDHIIPEDATVIPPPNVERGQMPFFNICDQRWEVRAVPYPRKSIWRDKFDATASSEESQ
jgi:hypothetical protein